MARHYCRPLPSMTIVVEPLYFSDEKSTQLRNDKHNDAIHQLDKLDSFPAVAFELFSSMARALDL